MNTLFEKEYKDISDSELWKILKEKAEKEELTTEFLDGVGAICAKGITLSKAIIKFFPKFTLHDITHIRNVCKWMIELLGDRKNDLSATEAALLVMAACCHDIGMSVSEEQEKDLKKDPNRGYWKEHFQKNLKDEEEYAVTREITPQILRNYIRKNHHKRIGEQIKADEWPEALAQQEITRQNLIDLCRSHGEPLSDLEVPDNTSYDLRFCAALLRLADILDFDSTRAPDTLFKHLGLESPEDYEESISQLEWKKNRSGGFGRIKDRKINFRASFTSLQIEMQVEEYKKWVMEELRECTRVIDKYDSKWTKFDFPYEITNNVDRIGYEFGDFRLTMDQDEVQKLLVGENLYSDPNVFVRELLQNSIDAILARRELDPYFGKESGKITIQTWRDEEGYDWFRIEDNGIGMDKNIITKYFLKIGKSYYTSDEYKADRRHYARGEFSDSPISRFGIGILSCFLDDPKNNRLEVSTKRYSHSPDTSNSAIRLNVDGLHGYYYFAEEENQNEHDVGFRPMHSPDRQNNIGYRTEVGTTICVRTNIYVSNNVHSLEEIVDKYVQFADVDIEYKENGYCKKYPSKKELEQVIEELEKNSMEPGHIVIRHPLPDEIVKEVESNIPELEWTQLPTLKISYCALNKLSVGKGLSGLAIYVDVEASAKIHQEGLQLPLDEKVYEAEFNSMLTILDGKVQLNFSMDYPESLTRKVNYYLEKSKIMQKMEKEYSEEEQGIPMNRTGQMINLYNLRNGGRLLIGFISSELPYSKIAEFISKEEAKAWEMIMPALKNKGKGKINRDTIISYNGVLADKRDFFSYHQVGGFIGCVLTLSGKDYFPEVNLARDRINALPLNAILDIGHIRNRLEDFDLLEWNDSSDNYDDFSRKLWLVTEKEYYQFLDNNSIWESITLFNGKTVNDLNPGDKIEIVIPATDYGDFMYRGNAFYWLSIAILKKHFGISVLGKDISYSNQFHAILYNKTNDIRSLEFPVQLFYSFENDEQTFAICGCYNINHLFSQWLIKNQIALQERIPGIYNNLIEKMSVEFNAYEIKNSIISMLHRVRELGICEVDDNLLHDDYVFVE